jgi:NAD(P)-dependent dehydrogenase (short-subunit alcohol dehydrogenase family)
VGNDSVILVRPEESFQELVENLKNQDRLPSAVLHHLEQGDGLYALFDLYGADAGTTSGTAPDSLGVLSDSEPTASAISGFLKTLTLEDPRCLGKVVEIPAGVEQANVVLDEILENDWTAQEIRYRSDGETISRFASELVPHRGVEKKTLPLPLKQNGVYLITGGFGGLGRIFAEHLAKNHQAKLVLVGRSAPGALQQEFVERLESLGAEVLHLQADVSRRDDVERVVYEAEARFAKIDGVIHSAGVNRDAFILKKTKEEIKAVIAPKVSDAILLDLATSEKPLDFFVLFSSLASTTGNTGQCDYAYANRFLDVFAERRARTRPGHAVSPGRCGKRAGWRCPATTSRCSNRTGICPLPARDGIRYFELPAVRRTHGVALHGIAPRIRLSRAAPARSAKHAEIDGAHRATALSARRNVPEDADRRRISSIRTASYPILSPSVSIR